MYVRDMGTSQSQKRVSAPLELEFQMVLSHHEGAGNWTQVVCKSKKFS